MSHPKKSVFAKLKGLGTKTAPVRKKVDKKKDSELIEALCPKIDDVASSLCRRNVISEGKEENILCLQGSTIKAQFLMDVLNRKGQGAMTALYEVARNFQLWHAADILEPNNAPHGPRPPVIIPPRQSIDDVDGHCMNLPAARKVSFSDEVDDAKHGQDQEDEAMNATSPIPEGGDDDHGDSPGVSLENQSETSDIESETETGPEGGKKISGDDDSNDASSEESNPDSGDKSNTDCKTQDEEATGDKENDASSEEINPDSGDKSNTDSKTQDEEATGYKENDVSCEEINPDSGDKSNTDSKTQDEEATGDKENDASGEEINPDSCDKSKTDSKTQDEEATGDKENDASSEEINPDSGDKSNTDSKTQDEEATGYKEKREDPASMECP